MIPHSGGGGVEQPSFCLNSSVILRHFLRFPESQRHVEGFSFVSLGVFPFKPPEGQGAQFQILIVAPWLAASGYQSKGPSACKESPPNGPDCQLGRAGLVESGGVVARQAVFVG